MAKQSKRMKSLLDKIDRERFYPLDDVFTLIKESASAKFNEGVDISINLGVDAKKSDQTVRGSTVMPNGTGKSVRVAVFAEGAQADEAKAAGADVVGMQDLADEVKKGNINFDIVVATPDAMKVVGQLGQILGPRGLMPNPKVGTVTPKAAEAVKNAKSGQVQFRNDKSGIIHCSIGKASFSAEELKENFLALLGALQKAKPSSAKGQYISRVSVSTTMGPGIRVDRASLPA
ncbi:MAG: 50S ribosomal protein L1 [Gammaproteobacteria bacterium]|nr:50S ribosomal protein L1 [Gammaproteobacteria bacterium]